MFGYLVADTGHLTEDDSLRYRAAYCGLCRTLKDRHGTVSQLTLNYDMTFLVLLLSSLYEPEERTGEGRCLPHPIDKRRWVRTEMTEYAADMNVALAYLKCLDDSEDDHSLAARIEALFFKGAYDRVCEKYPRQCGAISDALLKLHELEKENCENVDETAACFGALMAEIFVKDEDRWSEVLRRFGMSLGRFIYIMDACMDLDEDVKKYRYNPLRRYHGEENEELFRDILRMTLGECVYFFDVLPLVQDVNILKNILCDGLWQEFNKKYTSRKDAPDVSGSV